MAKKATDPEPASDVVTDDEIDLAIGKLESSLLELRTLKFERAKQHYPKARYHADGRAVHVLNAQADAEAAGDGYTFDTPQGVA